MNFSAHDEIIFTFKNYCDTNNINIIERVHKQSGLYFYEVINKKDGDTI